MSIMNSKERKARDRGRKQGYVKAIDDFINAVNNIEYVPVCIDCLTKHKIIEIAEQLKESVKGE